MTRARPPDERVHPAWPRVAVAARKAPASLRQAHPALKADRELSCPVGEIADLRDVGFKMVPTSTPERAVPHSKTLADDHRARCAVIASRELAFGLEPMYSRCSGHPGHEVFPFQTGPDAEKWPGPAPESEGA